MTTFSATSAMTVLPASIPSPEQGVWHLGPLPLRGYALCIVAGIIVAIWLGNRRWIARGGAPGAVADLAIWAVPFGIIGARIYHVITDSQLYFGEGQDPVRALYVWEGGIGIWGAIAGGALGAWIACRRAKIPFAAMADALAPGIVLAQAIGRWGNWFNQELFGRPTDLPWGLEISPGNRPPQYADVETFHPTFLYESLWALAVAALLIWADRRFTLGHGRVFALYVAGYTLGRSFFEYLRVDPANEILGLRVNQWVSALLFVLAVVYVIVSARRQPGREDPSLLGGEGGASSAAEPVAAGAGVDAAGPETREAGSSVAETRDAKTRDAKTREVETRDGRADGAAIDPEREADSPEAEPEQPRITGDDAGR